VEFDLYRDRAQSHLPVAGNEGFYQKLDAAWARGLS